MEGKKQTILHANPISAKNCLRHFSTEKIKRLIPYMEKEFVRAKEKENKGEHVFYSSSYYRDIIDLMEETIKERR